MCIQYTTLYSRVLVCERITPMHIMDTSVLVIIVGASQSRNKVEQYQDKEPLVLTHHHATSFLRIITTVVLIVLIVLLVGVCAYLVCILLLLFEFIRDTGRVPSSPAAPLPIQSDLGRPVPTTTTLASSMHTTRVLSSSTLTVMPEYIVPCLYSYSSTTTSSNYYELVLVIYCIL